jgi:hypothetical protein
MYAQTPEELKRLLAAHPGGSPSTFLDDSSYAAWCYDHLTRRELKSAFHRDADPEACAQWGLSAIGFKQQIEMAWIARTIARR